MARPEMPEAAPQRFHLHGLSSEHLDVDVAPAFAVGA